MRPDEHNADLRIPQRPIAGANASSRNNSSAQPAAANIVRSQIDNIYDNSQQQHQQQSIQDLSQYQQQLDIENPYERTHSAAPKPQAENWKQYHSAWQDYYQKYYERYYTYHLGETKKQLEAKATSATQPILTTIVEQSPSESTASTATISHEEAMYDLRHKLLTTVKASSKKARSSRHFIPIAAALLVVFVFIVLQYNRVFIANVRAYVSPGSINPQNIIIDPTSTIAVSPEPRLIIPKINVDVPTIYGVGYDHDSQMKAMESGVAHFAIPGANSVPGQVGNTVLSGHSSNDLLDQGDYKFIFAQLDKLQTSDMIYINYQTVRYSYTVTKKEVVMPTEVNKLIYDTDKPILTLITCTPLGTSEKRLLVTAEQVSPDPSEATAAAVDSSNSESVAIPGNSPTFFERLFGKD